MKKLTLIILMTFFLTSLVFSQDVIIKNNGDEINAKVLEITENSIKYKEYNFQDGPIRSISKTEALMIIYENGIREKFSIVENQNIKNKYKGNYFMVGWGIGSSYGVLGVRFQGRFGDIQGFGIHAGIGGGSVDLKEALYWSLGVKFFPYKGFYLNTQYGVTQTEVVYDRTSQTSDRQLRYGSSVLIGGDWNWGKKIGFGLNFGFGVQYSPNVVEKFNEFTGALDLGFIIRI